jgi:hypothetical protein
VTEAERLLRETLVSVEWGSIALDEDHRGFRACPACRGVDPSDPVAVTRFAREWTGHRPGCRIAFVLTRAVPA